jgi:uncharacterized protein YggE
MNPDYNNKENAKGLLVASILLGAGLLSATLVGIQFFSPQAAAQENTTNGTTVELDCPPDSTICEQQIDDGSAVSQVDSNSDGMATVSTSGSATTKVEPDKVSVTVGVQTNGTTAGEAASKNANLTEDVLAAITALGIPEDQISTSNYNVYPTYSMKEPPEACIMIYPPPPECQPGQDITGYVASSSLTVELDVNGEIDGGEVIDAAIGAGANTVSGVFFFISTERQEEIRDGLIGDAIENARHRADVAAMAVGMEVSGVKAIHLNDVYFPVFSSGFDATLREGAATELLPGEQEVTMSVTVIYTMS